MFDLTYQKRQFCKPIKDELFRPLVVSPILCAICQVLSLHLILKGKVQFRFNINIDKDFILTRSAPSSGILREISPHLGAAWVKIKVLSMFIFHCDSPLVALIIIFKTDINGKPKYKKWICIGTLMGISTVITVYTLVKRLLRTGFWLIFMIHRLWFIQLEAEFQRVPFAFYPKTSNKWIVRRNTAFLAEIQTEL